MIPEQAKNEVIRRRAAGQTWTSLARWLHEMFEVEIHRTTLQRWHDKEVYSNGSCSEELTNVETLARDKKVETLKAEAKLWKKLYEKSIQETAKKDVIVDAIHTFTPAFDSVSPILLKKTTRKRSRQIVVAPLSDTHVGDNVQAEQLGGLNEYSIDIFNRRLFGWANLLLRLVELRRNNVPIDTLVIPMLGDMISGDIHDELARTNIDNCMGQMIRGANLISQAIMLLAPNFEKIHIPCVVGNHGRMTRKPPMKDKYMDWDYMLYQWIAAFCKNQKNITFDIPKSFINLFSVYDNTILIMHGDSVSGGGSNTSITRAITSLRGVLQYRKNLNVELGIEDETIQFDNVMIGHFHRIDEIDIGTGELHICGCMKGPDEFALQRLHKASKPKQLVTYWHPKYGYIGKEVIYLNRYDKPPADEDMSGMFVDSLPDTWADKII